MRHQISFFESPQFRCNNLIAGITAVIGIIGGILLITKTTKFYICKITDKRKKLANIDDNVCNVCCLDINYNDDKAFVKCAICQKHICRRLKCAIWSPNSFQWECELCKTSEESFAKTSSWVADQISSQDKLTHSQTAKNEIYTPLSEYNDNSMYIASTSQSEANSPIITREQKLRIREYVEEIVANILGGNLDTTVINKMSKDENYLQTLKANKNVTCDNKYTDGPDLIEFSEARLRQLIQRIIAETTNLSLSPSNHTLSETALDTFAQMPFNNRYYQRTEKKYFEPKIYQDLLATAVLNKIVDKQLKSAQDNDFTHEQENDDGKKAYIRHGDLDLENNFGIENLSTTSGSSDEPQSDCSITLMEHILNANIKKHCDLQQNMGSHMVPLPDLMAGPTESEDELMSVTPNAIGDGTWETNWLFKKKKHNSSGSATISSTGMLVPDPTENVRAQIGDKTTDEISDLSEFGSDSDDSLDILHSKLEPISDRLMSKHLIGGANDKMILDELIEKSSIVSNNLPTRREQYYTESFNENVVDVKTKNEAINNNVYQQISNENDCYDGSAESIFTDENSNSLEASDDFSTVHGCTGFSTVEVMECSPYTPSVVEMLAAMTLGPMLAVPGVNQPSALTISELNALNNLKKLALSQIQSHSLELLSHNLDVIPEESNDGTHLTECDSDFLKCEEHQASIENTYTQQLESVTNTKLKEENLSNAGSNILAISNQTLNASINHKITKLMDEEIPEKRTECSGLKEQVQDLPDITSSIIYDANVDYSYKTKSQNEKKCCKVLEDKMDELQSISDSNQNQHTSTKSIIHSSLLNQENQKTTLESPNSNKEVTEPQDTTDSKSKDILSQNTAADDTILPGEKNIENKEFPETITEIISEPQDTSDSPSNDIVPQSTDVDIDSAEKHETKVPDDENVTVELPNLNKKATESQATKDLESKDILSQNTGPDNAKEVGTKLPGEENIENKEFQETIAECLISNEIISEPQDASDSPSNDIVPQSTDADIDSAERHETKLADDENITVELPNSNKEATESQDTNDLESKDILSQNTGPDSAMEVDTKLPGEENIENKEFQETIAEGLISNEIISEPQDASDYPSNDIVPQSTDADIDSAEKHETKLSNDENITVELPNSNKEVTESQDNNDFESKDILSQNTGPDNAKEVDTKLPGEENVENKEFQETIAECPISNEINSEPQDTSDSPSNDIVPQSTDADIDSAEKHETKVPHDENVTFEFPNSNKEVTKLQVTTDLESKDIFLQNTGPDNAKEVDTILPGEENIENKEFQKTIAECLISNEINSEPQDASDSPSNDIVPQSTDADIDSAEKHETKVPDDENVTFEFTNSNKEVTELQVTTDLESKDIFLQNTGPDNAKEVDTILPGEENIENEGFQETIAECLISNEIISEPKDASESSSNDIVPQSTDADIDSAERHETKLADDENVTVELPNSNKEATESQDTNDLESKDILSQNTGPDNAKEVDTNLPGEENFENKEFQETIAECLISNEIISEPNDTSDSPSNDIVPQSTDADIDSAERHEAKLADDENITVELPNSNKKATESQDTNDLESKDILSQNTGPANAKEVDTNLPGEENFENKEFQETIAECLISNEIISEPNNTSDSPSNDIVPQSTDADIDSTERHETKLADDENITVELPNSNKKATESQDTNDLESKHILSQNTRQANAKEVDTNLPGEENFENKEFQETIAECLISNEVICEPQDASDSPSNDIVPQSTDADIDSTERHEAKLADDENITVELPNSNKKATESQDTNDLESKDILSQNTGLDNAKEGDSILPGEEYIENKEFQETIAECLISNKIISELQDASDSLSNDIVPQSTDADIDSTERHETKLAEGENVTVELQNSNKEATESQDTNDLESKENLSENTGLENVKEVDTIFPGEENIENKEFQETIAECLISNEINSEPQDASDSPSNDIVPQSTDADIDSAERHETKLADNENVTVELPNSNNEASESQDTNDLESKDILSQNTGPDNAKEVDTKLPGEENIENKEFQETIPECPISNEINSEPQDTSDSPSNDIVPQSTDADIDSAEKHETKVPHDENVTFEFPNSNKEVTKLQVTTDLESKDIFLQNTGPDNAKEVDTILPGEENIENKKFQKTIAECLISNEINSEPQDASDSPSNDIVPQSTDADIDSAEKHQTKVPDDENVTFEFPNSNKEVTKLQVTTDLESKDIFLQNTGPDNAKEVDTILPGEENIENEGFQETIAECLISNEIISEPKYASESSSNDIVPQSTDADIDSAERHETKLADDENVTVELPNSNKEATESQDTNDLESKDILSQNTGPANAKEVDTNLPGEENFENKEFQETIAECLISNEIISEPNDTSDSPSNDIVPQSTDADIDSAERHEAKLADDENITVELPNSNKKATESQDTNDLELKDILSQNTGPANAKEVDTNLPGEENFENKEFQETIAECLISNEIISEPNNTSDSPSNDIVPQSTDADIDSAERHEAKLADDENITVELPNSNKKATESHDTNDLESKHILSQNTRPANAKEVDTNLPGEENFENKEFQETIAECLISNKIISELQDASDSLSNDIVPQSTDADIDSTERHETKLAEGENVTVELQNSNKEATESQDTNDLESKENLSENTGLENAKEVDTIFPGEENIENKEFQETIAECLIANELNSEPQDASDSPSNYIVQQSTDADIDSAERHETKLADDENITLELPNSNKKATESQDTNDLESKDILRQNTGPDNAREVDTILPGEENTENKEFQETIAECLILNEINSEPQDASDSPSNDIVPQSTDADIDSTERHETKPAEAENVTVELPNSNKEATESQDTNDLESKDILPQNTGPDNAREVDTILPGEENIEHKEFQETITECLISNEINSEPPDASDSPSNYIVQQSTDADIDSAERHETKLADDKNITVELPNSHKEATESQDTNDLKSKDILSQNTGPDSAMEVDTKLPGEENIENKEFQETIAECLILNEINSEPQDASDSPSNDIVPQSTDADIDSTERHETKPAEAENVTVELPNSNKEATESQDTNDLESKDILPQNTGPDNAREVDTILPGEENIEHKEFQETITECLISNEINSEPRDASDSPSNYIVQQSTDADIDSAERHETKLADDKNITVELPNSNKEATESQDTNDLESKDILSQNTGPDSAMEVDTILPGEENIENKEFQETIAECLISNEIICEPQDASDSPSNDIVPQSTDADIDSAEKHETKVPHDENVTFEFPNLNKEVTKLQVTTDLESKDIFLQNTGPDNAKEVDTILPGEENIENKEFQETIAECLISNEIICEPQDTSDSPSNDIVPQSTDADIDSAERHETKLADDKNITAELPNSNKEATESQDTNDMESKDILSQNTGPDSAMEVDTKLPGEENIENKEFQETIAECLISNEIISEPQDASDSPSNDIVPQSTDADIDSAEKHETKVPDDENVTFEFPNSNKEVTESQDTNDLESKDILSQNTVADNAKEVDTILPGEENIENKEFQETIAECLISNEIICEPQDASDSPSNDIVPQSTDADIDSAEKHETKVPHDENVTFEFPNLNKEVTKLQVTTDLESKDIFLQNTGPDNAKEVDTILPGEENIENKEFQKTIAECLISNEINSEPQDASDSPSNDIVPQSTDADIDSAEKHETKVPDDENVTVELSNSNKEVTELQVTTYLESKDILSQNTGPDNAREVDTILPGEENTENKEFQETIAECLISNEINSESQDASDSPSNDIVPQSTDADIDSAEKHETKVPDDENVTVEFSNSNKEVTELQVTTYLESKDILSQNKGPDIAKEVDIIVPGKENIENKEFQETIAECLISNEVNSEPQDASDSPLNDIVPQSTDADIDSAEKNETKLSNDENITVELPNSNKEVTESQDTNDLESKDTLSQNAGPDNAKEVDTILPGEENIENKEFLETIAECLILNEINSEPQDASDSPSNDIVPQSTDADIDSTERHETKLVDDENITIELPNSNKEVTESQDTNDLESKDILSQNAGPHNAKEVDTILPGEENIENKEFQETITECLISNKINSEPQDASDSPSNYIVPQSTDADIDSTERHETKLADDENITVELSNLNKEATESQNTNDLESKDILSQNTGPENAKEVDTKLPGEENIENKEFQETIAECLISNEIISEPQDASDSPSNDIVPQSTEADIDSAEIHKTKLADDENITVELPNSNKEATESQDTNDLESKDILSQNTGPDSAKEVDTKLPGEENIENKEFQETIAECLISNEINSEPQDARDSPSNDIVLQSTDADIDSAEKHETKVPDNENVTVEFSNSNKEGTELQDTTDLESKDILSQNAGPDNAKEVEIILPGEENIDNKEFQETITKCLISNEINSEPQDASDSPSNYIVPQSTDADIDSTERHETKVSPDENITNREPQPITVEFPNSNKEVTTDFESKDADNTAKGDKKLSGDENIENKEFQKTTVKCAIPNKDGAEPQDSNYSESKKIVAQSIDIAKKIYAILPDNENIGYNEFQETVVKCSISNKDVPEAQTTTDFESKDIVLPAKVEAKLSGDKDVSNQELQNNTVKCLILNKEVTEPQATNDSESIDDTELSDGKNIENREFQNTITKNLVLNREAAQTQDTRNSETKHIVSRNVDVNIDNAKEVRTILSHDENIENNECQETITECLISNKELSNFESKDITAHTTGSFLEHQFSSDINSTLTRQCTVVEVKHTQNFADDTKNPSIMCPPGSLTNSNKGKPKLYKKLQRQCKVLGATPSFEDVSPQITPKSILPRSSNALSKIYQNYISDKHFPTALEKRRRRTLLMHRFLCTLDLSSNNSIEENHNISNEALNNNNNVFTEEFFDQHGYDSVHNGSSNSFSFNINELETVSYNSINDILFSDYISHDSNPNDYYKRTSTVDGYIDSDNNQQENLKRYRNNCFIPATTTNTTLTTTFTEVISNRNTNILTTTNTNLPNTSKLQTSVSKAPELSNNYKQHEHQTNFDKQIISDGDGDNKDDDDDENDNLEIFRHFLPGSIAEREYKKWYNAVEMPNNPYAPEALKRRISGSQERFIDLPNICPIKELNTLNFFKASNSNSDETQKLENDYKRYSRDYYINSSSTSSQSTPVKDFSVHKDNNEHTNCTLSYNNDESSFDLCKAIPVQVLESNSLTIDSYEIPKQARAASEWKEVATTETASDDSDTMKINDLHEHETAAEKEKSNAKSETNEEKSNKMESCINLSMASRGSTPTAFKFLQPKRKLLEPSQVLSVDEYIKHEVTATHEKPVIEEEVAKALPSVKALARAFLLASNTTQSEKHWIKKAKAGKIKPETKKSIVNPNRLGLRNSEDVTITSDLSSLETDSASAHGEAEITTDITNPSINAKNGQVDLKTNIAFFENLRNK